MIRTPLRTLALAALLTAGLVHAQPAGTTKDIVLDRLTAPAPMPNAPPAAARSDAMAVSVLLESPNGTLTPRGTDRLFATGDRFRVKILAARDGKVALYNTNPRGVLGKEPVWRGDVKVGLETITPRLRLDGNSGVDYLHVVLEPQAPPQGLVGWLTSWLNPNKDGSPGALSKDIRLDVQNTESTTYLLNGSGQGLVTPVRIVHR